MEDTTPHQPINLGQLYAALAKAQGAFKAVAKNRTVTIRPRDKAAYTFRYADLEQLLECTRPALAANGLSVVQLVLDSKLVTVLGHESGASIRSELPLPGKPESDPKTYGAMMTYLRRYAYGALLGLAADDDLDEDGQEAGSRPGGRDDPQHTERPALIREGEAKAMEGMPAWSAWFNALSPADRAVVMPHTNAMKDCARKVPAEAKQ